MATSSPLQSQRPKRERKQVTRRPEVVAAGSKTAERRKTSVNPLDGLLRDKHARERKGTDETAFLKAELRESSAETDQNMDDEETAKRLADEGVAFSGAAYRDDKPHELNLAKSRKTTIKLLGAEAGEAAMRIIETDRLAGPEEGKSTRPVQIWACAMGVSNGEDMDVDEAPEPFPVWEAFEGESKTMVVLREVWANNGTSFIHIWLCGSLLTLSL